MKTKAHILGILILGLTLLSPQKVRAQACTAAALTAETAQWALSAGTIMKFIDDELTAQEDWLVESGLEDRILPNFKKLADQMTTVAMQQALSFGMFFDAKQQVETQRMLQTLQARAQKDYHPSTGMCTFGSTVKSLAASERNAEVNALFLSQRSQDRQLGNANTSAQFGSGFDVRNRLAQFRTDFCDPSNNNGALEAFCGDGPENKTRLNKDIDFARTIDQPWSLNVNFTDANLQDDEEDLMALASNLYAFDVFSRPSTEELQFRSNANELNDAQRSLMDMRAIVAKRSVAENSFNNIAAMKSAGSGGSTQFLRAIMQELGITNGDDLTQLLGQNPSYHAQMEVLTKKIYQNPDFFTNLYDKPVNVRRKGVALQGIGLMQKFDMLDSALRQEASLAVLLEIAVDDLQSKQENEQRGSN